MSKLKENWSIILIVICIYVYSLLSWMNFYIEATINSISGIKDISIIERMDYYINELDTKWNSFVYQKEFLSKIDSIFTYVATKEVLSNQVVLGQKNWLFYKTKIDGDPIADFEGTNQYTLSKINSITKSALFAQNQLENRGIKFALLVVPNKENVYAENMPKIYNHSKISRTDTLNEQLKKNGVNIVDPKSELLENHLNFQLYYSYDTHWNQLGAYIGVRDVLKSWNINVPQIKDTQILNTELKDNYHYCGKDDLADLVGLKKMVFNDEIEYEIVGSGNVDWEKFEAEQDKKKVSYFNNDKAKLSKTVLLVGDSFRTSMIPALMETFTDVYVVHRSCYKVGLLDDIKPDYLIAEYVERYSYKIESIYSLVK